MPGGAGRALVPGKGNDCEGLSAAVRRGVDERQLRVLMDATWPVKGKPF